MSTKRIVISTGVIIGVLVLLLFCLYNLINSEKFQVVGQIINRIDTNKKIVALTFDDGPNELTQEILAILYEKNVLATFYVIGKAIEANPEYAKQIVKDGHELGNHSYSHQRNVFKSPTFIASEIEKTNSLIKAAGYTGEVTFRPPYGKKLITLPMYLNKHQIKTITWDVEPLKALKNPTKDEVARYVTSTTKPGSIILLHPWSGEVNVSRQALPEIIDNLKANGFEFVTISTLLHESF